MATAENETIAINPLGILGVVLKEIRPENGADLQDKKGQDKKGARSGTTDKNMSVAMFLPV